MNYTHLGRTGLKVSRLCLGTLARTQGRSAPGLCLVITVCRVVAQIR